MSNQTKLGIRQRLTEVREARAVSTRLVDFINAVNTQGERALSEGICRRNEKFWAEEREAKAALKRKQASV